MNETIYKACILVIYSANCKLQEYMAYYNSSTGTQPNQQGEAETLQIRKYNVLTEKYLSKEILKHSIVVSHWQL